MSNANAVMLVLGVVLLLLSAALVFVFVSKSASEQALRAQIDELRSQATEAAKSVGQIEELNRTLSAQQTAARGVEAALDAERKARSDMAAELATAKSEVRAAEEGAERQARHEREKAQSLIDAERDARGAILKAKDGEIAAKNEEIAALKEFVDKANATLGDQFKSISHDTLKEFSAQFEVTAGKVFEKHSEATAQNVKLHKEQIANMLQPVEMTLKKLNEQVNETNEKRGAAEAVLMSQIKDFAGANEKLANALNKPVIRGSFAEAKLESLLEAAGLVLGENFDLQVPVKDGEQLRMVDALIHLPQGRKLVIDSKNLLLPFVEYANCIEEDRAARLSDFQRHFRTTLKSLSMKDYSKHWPGIDAVIMFLPDEGMYFAAISEDRQLIATMFENRVFTVSPISLLPILRSVAYILGLEKQNRDTQHIVDAGKGLYESLGVLISKLHSLGSKLDDGVSAYNQVIASFEGRVLPRTRMLHNLGVKKGADHKVLSSIEHDRRSLKDQNLPDLAAVVDVGLLALPLEEEDEPLTAP